MNSIKMSILCYRRVDTRAMCTLKVYYSPLRKESGYPWGWMLRTNLGNLEIWLASVSSYRRVILEWWISTSPLPPISLMIPTFSGDLSRFEAFLNIFNSVYDGSEIGRIERLMILQSRLRSEWIIWECMERTMTKVGNSWIGATVIAERWSKRRLELTRLNLVHPFPGS